MDIPYRLDTPEAISKAMEENLLGLGGGYETMLAAAARISLHRPPALSRARPFVAKSFTLPQEKVVFRQRIICEQPHALENVRDFALIESVIPWIKDLPSHGNIGDFLRSFPVEVQRLCKVDPPPVTAPQMLQSAWATRKYLRREIVSYAKSKKAKRLDRDQFKKLLVGFSLFDTRNEDLLQTLAAAAVGVDPPLYQHAVAELLFARLPASIEELVVVNPKAIRRKLLAKIAKLPIRAMQKTNLCGEFPSNISQKELIPALHKIERISRRLNIAEDTKRSFQDYMLSIVDSIDRARGLHGELFIGKEIAEARKLYAPRTTLRAQAPKHVEVVIPIRKETLEFHPTKDYLDLFRGRISKDCIDAAMSEGQLKVPVFFNIRIFRNDHWIGNMYMLDFTQTLGVLLVDRIQMPRTMKAEYVHFFEDVAEALAELFANVEYREILAPIAISNHASIQKGFNAYKKKLAKRRIRFHPAGQEHFESLRRQSFYVLHTKSMKAVSIESR